jgi:hypothetical protein
MNKNILIKATFPTTLRLGALLFGMVVVATALVPLWQAAALIA